MYFSVGSCDKRRKNKESTTIFGWQSQAQILLMCCPDIDERKNKKRICSGSISCQLHMKRNGTKIYDIESKLTFDVTWHIEYAKQKKTNTKQIYFGPSKIQKCQSMQISGTHLYSGRRAHPPPPSTATHKDLCVFHIDNALTMNFHQILFSHSSSRLSANCCIIYICNQFY